MRLIDTITRLLVPQRTSDEATHKHVYRLVGAGEIGTAWERRIVQLSDGRSVGEIKETLFNEELEAGASSADIGLWKNLFDRGVLNTIGDLASRGWVRLTPAEQAKEEPDGK